MATCTVSDAPEVKGSRIDVAPLRRAFQRSGMTAARLAHALGWHYVRDGRPCGDGTRVECALGIADQRGRGSGRPHHAATIDSALAARIADAIGVDPRDVGCTGHPPLTPSQVHAASRCATLAKGTR